MKTIITISRQYGSGGHEIGKLLAEHFDIPFYDNELIALAAKKAHMGEEELQRFDERAARFWEYSGMFLDYLPENQNPFSYLPMNDQLFHMQKQIIVEAARTGSCVIVGRCADEILADNAAAVHVFIQAGLERRIDRIATTMNITPKEARERISKVDKSRGAYYNYYTNRKWGAREYYDLVIASDRLGIKNSARLVIEYLNTLKNKLA